MPAARRAAPKAAVPVFLEEMGYCRWPEAAPDRAPRAPVPPPVAAHGQATTQPWRSSGARNVLAGRVDDLDNYIVGRK